MMTEETKYYQVLKDLKANQIEGEQQTLINFCEQIVLSDTSRENIIIAAIAREVLQSIANGGVSPLYLYKLRESNQGLNTLLSPPIENDPFLDGLTRLGKMVFVGFKEAVRVQDKGGKFAWGSVWRRLPESTPNSWKEFKSRAKSELFSLDEQNKNISDWWRLSADIEVFSFENVRAIAGGALFSYPDNCIAPEFSKPNRRPISIQELAARALY